MVYLRAHKKGFAGFTIYQLLIKSGYTIVESIIALRKKNYQKVDLP